MLQHGLIKSQNRGNTKFSGTSEIPASGIRQAVNSSLARLLSTGRDAYGKD